MDEIIQYLDQNIADCKDSTKEQVTVIQDMAAQVKYTEESIIANLADKKNHIELMMTKMKMQHSVHDYIEYGLSLGDIYLTLVAQ